MQRDAAGLADVVVHHEEDINDAVVEAQHPPPQLLQILHQMALEDD